MDEHVPIKPEDAMRVLRSPIAPDELSELIRALILVHSACREAGFEAAAARVTALALLVGDQATSGFAEHVEERLRREWRLREDGDG